MKTLVESLLIILVLVLISTFLSSTTPIPSSHPNPVKAQFYYLRYQRDLAAGNLKAAQKAINNVIYYNPSGQGMGGAQKLAKDLMLTNSRLKSYNQQQAAIFKARHPHFLVHTIIIITLMALILISLLIMLLKILIL